MPRRASFWITASAIVGMAFFVAMRFQIRASVLDFFTSSTARDLGATASRLADSSLTRRMVMTVSSSRDPAEARAAARELTSRLARVDGIRWARCTVDEAVEKAYYDLYFPRRFYFFAEDPARELPEELSPPGIARLVAGLKDELSLPTGAFVRDLAPRDPWLTFVRQLRRLEAARSSSVDTVGGQLVSRDGHALIFVGLRDSALSAERQAPVLAGIETAFAEVSSHAGGTLTLEQTGANRFAVLAERTIRGDITRISRMSTIAIVVLFLLLFGSLRYVVLALVPLVAGAVAAMFATLVCFGHVHAITFAFGSALLGVCIDYPSLTFAQHRLGDDGCTPEETVGRIRIGLLLAVGTTIAGVAALAGTAFPGIREMALFTCSGVAAALATTTWVVAPLLPPGGRPGRALRVLARALEGTLAAAHRRPRWFAVVPTAALAVCALGIPRMIWLDRLADLYRIEGRVVDEDARVQKAVGVSDAGRFVVAFGDGAEAALERNDAVYARLVDARQKKVLSAFDSVHTFLWSKRTQLENQRLIQGDGALADRTLRELRSAGFDETAFEPFRAELAQFAAGPLELPTLQGSTLGPLVEPFVVELDGRHAIVTFVHGVTDAKELEARVSGVPEAHYLDYNALLDGIYKGYRENTLRLVLVGLGLVLLATLVRYRRFTPAAAAMVPALIGAATVAGLLGIAGAPLHLLHLLSLLLVLGMGVDYGVFMVEAERSPGNIRPLPGVLLACLATVLSFGLLSLSKVPALHAVGITTALGMALTFVLSPCAAILARIDRDRS